MAPHGLGLVLVYGLLVGVADPDKRAGKKAGEKRHGQARATLRGHELPVSSVAFTGDGKLLASGSHDGTIKLWDVATAKQRLSLDGHSGWPVFSVAFSPDGKQLASGSHDRTTKLWDVATGKQRPSLQRRPTPGRLSA